MIHEASFRVTPDHGPRPAGPPDACFYCQQPLGALHAQDCVLRTQSVVVRVETEYVITVPAHWDAAMVEFARNEGTWCADNGVREILHLRRVRRLACYCPLLTWHYVREATEEDERTLGPFDPAAGQAMHPE